MVDCVDDWPDVASVEVGWLCGRGFVGVFVGLDPRLAGVLFS